MFWVLKAPKLAVNFINGLLNNNFTLKADAQGGQITTQKGYNRLSADDDINGNPSLLNTGSEDCIEGAKSGSCSSKFPKGSSTCSSSSNDALPHLSTADVSPMDVEMKSIVSSASRIDLGKILREAPTFVEYNIDTSDDDDDEALTCAVCDRSFLTPKQLASHQLKRKHFGCYTCEDVFPSLAALESHRVNSGHYSETDELSCEEEDELLEDEDEDDSEERELKENLLC